LPTDEYRAIFVNAGWYIVVNPVAGKGKGLSLWEKISDRLDALGLEYAHAVSEYHLHPVALTMEALRNGYRNILAVGGDGTVNEIVNGIFSQQYVPAADVLLSSVSIGTGNDWIRNTGIPRDWRKAVDLIAAGEKKFQDIGLVTYYEDEKIRKRYFAVIAGGGFDSLVVAKTRYSKGNKITYLAGILRSLFSYRKECITVVADGQTTEHEVLLLVCTIGRYCGGGMRLTPDADTGDGYFDVGILGYMSRAEILWNIRRLYDGTIKNHPKMKILKAKNIRMTSSSKIFLEADGELLGHTPAEFQLLPSALRVLAPG
jgi:YegS/Rv2252/BmrU family lipid kinase